MDQLVVFWWVQRNVVRFGGDLVNVIIIGELAGGMSVYALLVLLFADGLFVKVVIMFGGDGTLLLIDIWVMEVGGVEFGKKKGIVVDDL